MTKVNYTLLNPNSINIDNIGEEIDLSNASLYSVVPFRNTNVSLATWSIYKNGYVGIKAQLINNNHQTLIPELQLARFNSIRYLKADTFDDGTSLIAWSVRVPNTNKSSILITHTLAKPKLYHIHPSYDGRFEIATVPNTTEFVVAYINATNRALTLKQYNITNSTSITIQNRPIEIDTSASRVQFYLATFYDNLIYLTWSQLDYKGINVEKMHYDINHNTSYHISTNVSNLLFDSRKEGEMVIAWKEDMLNNFSYNAIVFDKEEAVLNAQIIGNNTFTDLMSVSLFSNANVLAYLATNNSVYERVILNNGTIIDEILQIQNEEESEAETESAERRRFHPLVALPLPECLNNSKEKKKIVKKIFIIRQGRNPNGKWATNKIVGLTRVSTITAATTIIMSATITYLLFNKHTTHTLPSTTNEISIFKSFLSSYDLPTQQRIVSEWIWDPPTPKHVEKLGGGFNPSVNIKDGSGRTLVVGKTIQSGKNYQSLATLAASHLIKSSSIFSSFISNTLVPNNKFIVENVEHTMQYQGNEQTFKFRVASEWLKDVKRLQEMFEETCTDAYKCRILNRELPFLHQICIPVEQIYHFHRYTQKVFSISNAPNQGECTTKIFNKVLSFDSRSVAAYLMSQFLTGGGDFSTGNIAYHTRSNGDAILFKFDLDVSFVRGISTARDGEGFSCNENRLSAIYSPLQISSWNLFKEMLIYDGNLLFPSPRGAKWVISGSAVIAKSSTCDFTLDQGLLGLCRDTVSRCRNTLIQELGGSPGLDPETPDPDFEISYCTFLRKVFSYLDQYHNSILNQNNQNNHEWANVTIAISNFLNQKNELNTSQSCSPIDFAQQINTWFTEQHRAIVGMTTTSPDN